VKDQEMKQPQLTALEPLCDLQMVKAEYGVIGRDSSSGHYFRIQIKVAKQAVSVDVREDEGDVLAAELDVLATIIRKRVVRARTNGEESNQGKYI
jgi:hypothetical protein